MSKSFSLITPEAANGIYADGIRKARQLREKAAATRKIADALDGAFITVRLENKLSGIFPAYRVHIYKDSYSPRKFVSLHLREAQTYGEDWTIYLYNTDNRVNAEPIRKNADDLDAQAAAIEKALDSFFSTVGQYNAIATAYAGVFKQLHPLIEDMIWPDWNLNR